LKPIAIGQQVMVRKKSGSPGTAKKYNPKFIGPYTVAQILDDHLITVKKSGGKISKPISTARLNVLDYPLRQNTPGLIFSDSNLQQEDDSEDDLDIDDEPELGPVDQRQTQQKLPLVGEQMYFQLFLLTTYLFVFLS